MRFVPLALLAAVVISGCSSDDPKSAASKGDRPANAPPPLAKLYDQGNQLLGGGVDAYREQLRKLRGYPVVANAWASWCGPCRTEFPFFQSQALKRGAKVAFLGINPQDPNPKALLEDFPVPYPSFKDPDLKITGEADGVPALPWTVFYDSKGKRSYIHIGVYASEEKLVEDIERYAN